MRVYENGVPVDAQTKTDGFVTVTLPEVTLGKTYTVEVEYTESEKHFRRRLIDVLTRLEALHETKEQILRGTWKLSKEETLDFIRNYDKISENEKLYLIEEWQ